MREHFQGPYPSPWRFECFLHHCAARTARDNHIPGKCELLPILQELYSGLKQLRPTQRFQFETSMAHCNRNGSQVPEAFRTEKAVPNTETESRSFKTPGPPVASASSGRPMASAVYFGSQQQLLF